MTTDFLYAPTNNFGIDPLSGFDFLVYTQDSYTGQIVFLGKPQTFTMSIRNATETYLELGERSPVYLDGEIQIAWVMEQGLNTLDILYRTFGAEQLTRNAQLGRFPRFSITMDSNAVELASNGALRPATTPEQIARRGRTVESPFSDYYRGDGDYRNARGTGSIQLQRCKVDSFSLGLTPGRRVASCRWEGVAEGAISSSLTTQQFRRNLQRANSDVERRAFEANIQSVGQAFPELI